jgi:lysophospholipase L1-like esterase
MRTLHTLFMGAALALAAATAWAQTAPAPADGNAPGAAAPGTAAPGGRAGRGARGGGFGGPGGFGGGGGAARGGRSILDQVAIQGGDNSRIAHEHLLAKAKLGKGKVDVYFQGDSIFRRWGCTDPSYVKYYTNWKENFWGWNAGDFAWGADTIQNILWRMQNGELDDVNPKVVVFLGGTNNVNPNANVEDLTKGLTACFDIIHKKAPDATLIIVGILPRTPAGDIPVINQINDNIAKLADGKKTRFLNVNDKFIDKDGKLVPGMLNNDSLHPDTKGYQVIADAIKPILTEVLGPPAKEDHAPPPTGDPKVAPVYPPPAVGATQ